MAAVIFSGPLVTGTQDRPHSRRFMKSRWMEARRIKVPLSRGFDDPRRNQLTGRFMNKFRGFINYNGHLEVHNSLLGVLLADQPRIVAGTK
jgi:hypothetical protein